jgi:CDP-diacylglycerol---glycerol-3-phosphate 3-phosphatidyltransferase
MAGKERILNVSNLITLFRIILVFFVVYIILLEDTISYLIAFFLIIFVVVLDGIDGVVARKFNSTTEFGGIFDILGDRIVEIVLWVAFAYIQIIPLWIPLVVISRGLVTDTFRGYALSRGRTAFGAKTMMKGKIGIFFVSSRISRALYGFVKVLTFSMLALQLYLAGILYPNIGIFSNITYSLVMFTVAFCVLRGFFVIYDGLMLFKNYEG